MRPSFALTLAAVLIATPCLPVGASEPNLLTTGITGSLSSTGTANPNVVMRPIEVQRLLLEIAAEPQNRHHAEQALEGGDVTVEDLLALELLREDHGRLLINFSLLTQKDQAEIVRLASAHATALAEGFLKRRQELDALLEGRSLQDVPAADYAFILIGCFSLDWDGLRYTDTPKFRAGATHRAGDDVYTPWAREKGDAVSLRGLYWGSHNASAGGINLTTFGDHHALPRAGFPDLTWALDIETDHLPDEGATAPTMTSVVYRFLSQIHDAVAKVMLSLGSGPKSADELAAATHLDPETMTVLLRLLEEIDYIGVEGSVVHATIPVLTEADRSLVRSVLAIGREVIREWHEEHYDQLAAELGHLTPVKNGVPYNVVYTEVWHFVFGLTNQKLVEAGLLADPYGASRRHKGFIPVVWLPGQQLLGDETGPSDPAS